MFLDNLLLFLKNQENVNHLDFSGLQFKKEQLLDLSLALVECSMLLGVHLNDIDCLKTILPNSYLHTDKSMEDTLEILDIWGI